jgi:hypothetical protein
MDVKTLIEVLQHFENKKPFPQIGTSSFSTGYNEAIDNVKLFLSMLIVEHSSALYRETEQRIKDSQALVESRKPIPPMPPFPPVPVQKGELPDGWRFVEVNEFLTEGDVMNQTGMKIDTKGRDDIRCTASRTWRRKVNDV